MADKPRKAAPKSNHYHARTSSVSAPKLDVNNFDDDVDAIEATEPSSPDESTTMNQADFKTPDEAADADTDTSASHISAEAITPASQQSHLGKGARFRAWCGRHKVVVSIIAVVAIIIVLAGIPWTRYKIGGLFLKQTIAVMVTDSQTHKPVTSATLTARNVRTITDNKGQAKLRLPIGPATVTIQKTYYQTMNISTTVPITKPKTTLAVNLKATGRQVPISVVNALTGKPIENAIVTADKTEAKTDSKGQATMVLPTTMTTVQATVKATGYNNGTANIQITSLVVAANTIRITPAGMVYFLSNQSGKIDVVKASLDGTSRQTVLAGTGTEDTHGTVLLASRDWKYLALLSKRDGGANAKIFLIDTSTDKVTTMDEGTATFSLVGWSGHTFVYNVTRTAQSNWQPGYEAVKSYNADTDNLLTLDQTQATGDQNNNMYQSFGNYYITDNGVLYSVAWGKYPYGASQNVLAGKFNSIRSIGADGKNKKDLKTFDAVSNGFMESHAYEPQGIYYAAYSYTANAYNFYEYENGAVTATTAVTEDSFGNGTYTTYLYSPSGNNTFWTELRDGKHSLFVGDKNAQSPAQIASGTDYSTYGWYSDQYVLVAKNSSELYIMPVGGGAATKISDYYKPDISYQGYGYGYGGL